MELEKFVQIGAAAHAAVDEVIEHQKQKEYDRIETADAEKLLQQLGLQQEQTARNVAIVKSWLKKHWSDGWKAAGGTTGEPTDTRPKKKKPQGRAAAA